MGRPGAVAEVDPCTISDEEFQALLAEVDSWPGELGDLASDEVASMAEADRGRCVGVTEFAGIIGVTRQAVNQAIHEGRIRTVPGSKPQAIPVEQGIRDWKANTRPAVGSKVTTTSAPASFPPQDLPLAGPGEEVTYQRAHTAVEIIKAKRGRLAYDVESKRVVDAEAASRRWFEVGRRVRDLLFAMKSQAAPLLVAAVRSEPDDNLAVAAVDFLLDAQLRKALAPLEREPREPTS